MNCPRCGSGFNGFEFRGVQLDKCKDCGGIWFDEEELKKVRDMKLSKTELDEVDSIEQNKIDSDIGKCPKCLNQLQEINFMYESDIKVDACNVCGGLWLDQGELHQVIDYLSKNVDIEAEKDEYMKAYELAKEKSNETSLNIDSKLSESKILNFVYSFMSNFKLRK